ncbi:tRNA (adenosine(37)-N6)-threonylcarbamoyltransferase complex dimerization subunit type 1 TsaB [Metaclostridioides mangenotii]|uniref:tRNA (adenosine(37)-N6)-threonylcarbamoyltransferase complex dimerization subunit type 1 TsaB n=1 Tax=Metaclostridioides mangenotii TaxID=1540 RepID=UPI0004667943|nr:tRNA (adenosine(37)-N6)-threonylcarbamoyltransferase complex dimerization subunit type 1 TsaB [Clostridioides mangenotii]
MKVLGIDTSSMAASIAVIEDDKLICEFVVNDTKTHSQKLMVMIESMLKISDLDINDMDLLAVCIGPGSFTGIRIGVSTAKAISHVNDVPIVAVNSLESLAENASLTKKIIVPILDAQKNQVYSAEYKYNKTDNKDSLNVKKDIEIKEVDALVEEIKNSNEEYVILGEAVYKYSDKFKNMENATVCDSIYNVSKGSSICLSAINKYKLGKDIYNCYDIKPMYIKKSQAEIQYEQKNKEV